MNASVIIHFMSWACATGPANRYIRFLPSSQSRAFASMATYVKPKSNASKEEWNTETDTKTGAETDGVRSSHWGWCLTRAG
jgi:hypothetical protein